MTVCGYKDAKLYRIYLSEICYFEVVDGNSFIYTDTEVYEAHEKLYEFENKTIGSSLFRCSKSMILNADKIVYIKPCGLKIVYPMWGYNPWGTVQTRAVYPMYLMYPMWIS